MKVLKNPRSNRTRTVIEVAVLVKIYELNKYIYIYITCIDNGKAVTRPRFASQAVAENIILSQLNDIEGKLSSQ